MDIKIPLYIKFKDDNLIIYEFEHAIKDNVLNAELELSDDENDALLKNANFSYINKDISSNKIDIYKDDRLSKELKSGDSTNKSYQIFASQETTNNQPKPIKFDKLGINLLDQENLNRFIKLINKSKSVTRTDKGIWKNGDKEIGVKVVKERYSILIEGEMIKDNKKMGEGFLYLKENSKTILSIAIVAGGFGSGAPQNGKYTVDTYQNRRKNYWYNPGMNLHGVGFSFNLNPQFKTSRDLLRIHPDGNKKGTLGCIGVTGTKEELLKFEETMKNILKQQKSIGATINIKNNPNNSTSPKKITVRE